MAQYTTEAIIIGVKNWGEADKMVTLLSPEHGKIIATAFGSRRPKSPLAGALQMFNVVDVQLTKGERIDTVRQCTLKYHHKVMETDFNAMAYGSFVAELTANLAIENFPQVELYRKLRQILVVFGSRNPRIIALAASYQLLESTGMQLSYTHCVRSHQPIEGDAFFNIRAGGAVSKEYAVQEDMAYSEKLRKFICKLIEMDWEQENKFSINAQVLMAAERLMLLHLNDVLEKPLKSLDFLRQL